MQPKNIIHSKPEQNSSETEPTLQPQVGAFERTEPLPESELEIRHLTRAFSDSVAVEDFTFSARRGEIVTLLGPSGCGKTTTLRCVSGLERVDSGEISIGGVLVSSPNVQVPPHERQIGLVFQSYALWPHMSVFDNVSYGLRRKHVPRDLIQKRTHEILQLVGLGGLEGRLPSQISGGQQQRVALARSLVVEPRLLLLDEPLSNLDTGLRERVRREIRSILKRVGITAIYVTHDQREAISISDRIVLMKNGRCVQSGPPEELYGRPNAVFAATFLGAANLIAVSNLHPVQANGAGFVGSSEMGDVRGVSSVAEASPSALAMFRPERIRLLAESTGPEENCWPGRVLERLYQGEVVEYTVECHSLRLRVLSSIDAFHANDLVDVTIAPDQVHFLVGEPA